MLEYVVSDEAEELVRFSTFEMDDAFRLLGITAVGNEPAGLILNVQFFHNAASLSVSVGFRAQQRHLDP